MTCTDAQPLIARYADDEQALAANARAELEAHFASCAACRTALEEQRDVAGLLRGRLETTPQPGFVARVSARIDGREPGSQGAGEPGWLGIANWRAWTVGLAPIAAALFVAAYIDIRSTTSNGTVPAAAASFEEWTTASAPAALQSSATGDALIEAVLIGAVPSSGDAHVR
jgi:anti-sigma factor RsiW